MGKAEDFEIRKTVLIRYRGPGGDVTVPEGVTRIGEGAFRRCAGLTGAELPDSVTDIGPTAFCDCVSLRSVRIPDSVTGIGLKAFCGCGSLAEVRIPGGVTSIGNSVFSGCGSLRSVTIPEGVTGIEIMAFLNCRSLADLRIPDSVTSIGYCAFNGCESLTSLRIPDSVTSIGDYAFRSCGNLRGLVIPEGAVSIGKGAFSGCGALRDVTCFTKYAVSRVISGRMCLIYLGGPLSDLDPEYRIPAARGFMHAREQGIAETGQREEEYLKYIRGRVSEFLDDAEEDRAVLLFLVREGLLDENEIRYYLELKEDSDDIELKAALLQYRFEKSGIGGPGDFSL